MNRFLSSLKFHDEELIEGKASPPREDEEREKQVAWAMRSGMSEIERSKLTFGKHVIEHDDGRFFSAIRGTVMDAKYTNAIGFYIAESGWPIFLEPAPGAKDRDELAAQRERREQRRAELAKPRPWAKP